MIRAAGLAGLLLVSPAAAQDVQAPRHAVSSDVSFSTDADRTEVLRFGVNLDPRYRSPDDLFGFRLEQNRYRPSGSRLVTDERVYVRAAGLLGGKWLGRAQVGTDGDDLLGSVSVSDTARWRKEVFVERDKVETTIGVTRPILSTFAGAAIDVPLAGTTQATLLAGVQEFTGSNVRTHLRANLIQVIAEDLGVSAQLRTRYYRNSVPREFDYFSPKEHVEIVPVVQLRRFRGGWQYLLAGGYGAQSDTGAGWRSSRFLNARLSSPQTRRGLLVGAEAVYTNTPVGAGDAYDYLRLSLSLGRAF
jgi:hypothetical protein